MFQKLETVNGSKGVEIASLLLNGVPRRRCDVFVNYSLNFSRKSLAHIDKTIDEIWQVKCYSNKRLYNGSKFRFAGVRVEECGITLDIGLTSYKELMGTNCHSFGDELAFYGEKNFNCRQAYMADVLGVGSLIVTTDNKVVFIKRALWTGEDAGKLDRPGGHPEPDNVPLASALDSDCKYAHLSCELVLNEIFDSVLHEIRDEINLPVESLSDPQILGLVRSIDRCGRPTAEFLIRYLIFISFTAGILHGNFCIFSCSLSSEEVEGYYRQHTQPEADESVAIVFVAQEELLGGNGPEEIWSNLTDSACGAIELFHQCIL